jgi:hypothetical protein
MIYGLQNYSARVGVRDCSFGLDFGLVTWFGLAHGLFYCRAILLELEAGTSSIKMMAAKHPVSQDLMHGHSTAIIHFFFNSSQITK